ncbi:hypothetical protein BDN72DRAFT_894384 [Pluteus cervinus]|uniref:Uncharacterized protein n=1 Tax=Pluteus cervinus TaxID=181527 RepID=A0ACD3B575_9AGAR|nr:hypothetical protein BDN72DRAFT_894384 [Pluteus cervinus]
MPVVQIFRREENSSQYINPIYIAGFAVAGTIVLGFGIWIGLRTYRRRAASQREAERGAAFLSVRGLVREDQFQSTFAPQTQASTFSRDQMQMDASIILPDKTLPHPHSGRHEDILEYHRRSGSLPRPFALALAVGGGAPRPRPRGSILNPDSDSLARSSVVSMSSRGSRFSILSGSSGGSSPTTGTSRKVRQLFSPVLPDELLLSRLGEELIVIQSFDDGWCVVGREGSAFSSNNPKSLFKSNNPGPEQEKSVEMGVIPAWCFLKPVKGLRAERPIRASSLGITVQMEAPGPSRSELISWSNF